MGQTLTEKIFANHTNQKTVEAGDFVTAKIDLAFGNDITAPLAIKLVREMGYKQVFSPEKVMVIPDHFTPNKDIKSAEQAKSLREFAKDYHLKHYYEVGRVGIEHIMLPDEGFITPGMLVIGADSHTCTHGALGAFATGVGSTDLAYAWITGELWFKVPETIRFEYTGDRNEWVSGKDLILKTIKEIGVSGALYKAMEFSGPVVNTLKMADRFTMSNMAIEAGGKAGIFNPDDTTKEYLSTRTNKPYTPLHSDEDANFEKTFNIDVTDLEPQVAFPHLPENVRPVSEATHIPVDQVVIGSCTNGRIEDLEIAAKLLKGKKVHKNTRLIILPGTQGIYLEALRRGYVEIFVQAEGVFSTPTCGPCLGGHMGVLAAGEKALSTTNRNFVGRMGHPKSEVYLCNPAVAAASAITGHITPPQDVI
ncbi:MAG: 3-isopropylmalate dehydratase large subunit [Candidatus Ranarchaeia archaeon]|jgi:3-isopropylmalate/(R)-2-methylmalate dehydratase large subunit